MNFMDALNTRVGDIEKPLPVPVGTYIWVVSKAAKEMQRGEFTVLEFPIIAKEAYAEADDVDPNALAAFGDLKGSLNRVSFLFPNDTDAENEFKKTMNALKRFLLDILRVEGDEDSTIKELCAKAVGADFIGQASHRYVADKDDTYVDVKNYMPRD